MEQPGLIHANLVRKPDLFWLTGYAIILGTGVLIGVVLAFAPFVLLAVYRSAWLLIPLAAAPLGVWMAIRITKAGRKLVLRYKHLPEFRLFEDRVESVEWPNPLTSGVRFDKSTTPIRRSVRLDAVTSVAASFCIVRESVTKYGGRITETAPILYVRYRAGGRNELLGIPFPSHRDQAVNLWLSHFSDKDVPLQYTPNVLYRHDTQVLDDADRLRLLDQLTNLVPYRFSEGWQADEPGLRALWSAAERAELDAEEALDPELQLARARHPLRTWYTQLLIFIWLFMTVFFQQLAVAGRSVEPTDLLISFGAVFLFGFAFFFRLRSYLRWPYIFIYSGGALLTGVLAILAGIDLSAVEQDVAAVFCFATLCFQPFCWVPYLVVKKLSAGGKMRKEQVARIQQGWAGRSR